METGIVAGGGDDTKDISVVMKVLVSPSTLSKTSSLSLLSS